MIQSYNGNNSPYGLHSASYQLSCIDPRACKLRVDGKGSLLAQPDTAVLTLGVTTEGQQVQTAQQENARITSEVIQALTSMGIPSENIQTQSYTVEPRYDFVDGKQVFRGYQVQHMLRITVYRTDAVGRIIDGAVAAGANVVSSISFTLRDPSAYYRKALDLAVQDAVTKAASIGQKLQIQVMMTPVQVSEKAPVSAVPYQTMMVGAPQGTTPIQAGQLEITAEVEAVFGYYRTVMH